MHLLSGQEMGDRLPCPGKTYARISVEECDAIHVSKLDMLGYFKQIFILELASLPGLHPSALAATYMYF